MEKLNKFPYITQLHTACIKIWTQASPDDQFLTIRIGGLLIYSVN